MSRGTEYVGREIESRDGKLVGEVTNAGQPCRMEGCTGIRLSTRWPNGRRTFPCTKGLGQRGDRLVIL